MKAAVIHSFGPPEVIQTEEIAIPSPGEDEVLVRVRAVSVNPVDYKVRSGHYPAVKEDRLPLTLGRDVAGTVERCGKAARQFKPGDSVYAMLDRDHGGYAEYVIVKERDLAAKPERLDYTEAAAVPLAAMTAWQGLFDHGQLKSGQRVLIHGGAGGVGHFAIQFAKAKGATVATTVSKDDVDFARELGADQAIDYTSERFEDSVQDIDLVFDLVAGETQDRSWAVIKHGGTMISTLAKPSDEKARDHGARAQNYQAQPNADELKQITTLIDQGKVKPHIQAVFPFTEIPEAQQHLEHSHVQGKIVVELR
ncbi:MAG TPA: NADP-dependent oxidoreductase [Steroidobacteraceae bacterium]|jgi:NADPH:quinone reductase-like Zn-dependent oxidoreductase